ncbi:MAG: CPBP family intramembrane glutamic endopeptidase [Myxococcota bacterium]
MMNAPDHNPNEPYPDLRGAFKLTVLAIVAAAFTSIAFLDFGMLAAVGIGQAIGLGAVATMGAKRVAEPQAQRLGLQPLDVRMIPIILCMAPAVLLASEFDQWAIDFSGPSEQIESTTEIGFDDTLEDDATEQESPTEPDSIEQLINPEDPWSLLAAFVVMVGISPVVEEFLFRGVIQQGLVQRMGLVRGVTVVAILWTLLRPAPVTGFTRFLAAAIASFGLGWALGIVRIATASILGSILLASSWAAIGLAALAVKGSLNLPGMNIEGSHLPWSITLASVGLVAWAGRTLFQEAEQRVRSSHLESANPSD